MKFLHLDLRAFGCFTDALLDLSEEGRRFHLIYGANEAGKSTALRAITCLLYGIPTQTGDNFLHSYGDLRIGAHLLGTDGNSLQFLRRKGNKNTLLDLDEKPLPENALQNFLGGIRQETFSTMFGLDHATLLRGGQDLLEVGGDVAESLFEAGTGITGLHHILKGLEDEAGQLFSPQAKKPQLNKALDAYDKARKDIKPLTAGVWKRQEADLKKKQDDLEALKAELCELNAEKSRLERFQRALPRVASWKKLRADLKALGEVIVLPPSATDDRKEACKTLQESRLRRGDIEKKIDALQQQLDELQVPWALLESADEITRIHAQLDSYRNAIGDLPRVQAEQRGLEADARSILREIRPDLELEQVESLRLTIIQRKGIQRLATQHQTLNEQLRVAKERVRSAGTELENKKKALEETLLPCDSSELRRAVNRAVDQGPLEDQLTEEMERLVTLEEQAAIDLQRLGLWSGTLDELETLALPSLETVENFEDRFSSLKNKQKERENRLAEEREAVGRIERDIQALLRGGEVPTEEELAEARTRRERGWQLVRRAWLDGVDEPEDVGKFDPDRPLANAFEHSVARADDIADRLRREANRVAQLAGLLADRESSEQKRARIQEEIQGLLLEKEKLDREWKAAWDPAGVSPRSPKEMRAWLNRQNTLVEQIRGMREGRRSNTLLERRIQEHRGEIGRALEPLGDPAARGRESLAALIERSRARLEALDEATGWRNDLSKEVKRLTSELKTAEQERDKAWTALSNWQTEWSEAIEVLDLATEPDPDDVPAVLDRLTELFNKVEESRNRSERVEKMESYSRQFEKDVRRLVDSVAPDLADLPVEQAAQQLHILLGRARENEATRKQLKGQLKDRRRELEGCEEAIQKAERRLDELKAQARCDDLEQLEEAEKKSTMFLEWKGNITDVENLLAEDSAGSAVEQLIQEIEGVDGDQLPFQIGELEQRIQELDNERSPLEQQIGSDRAALKAIDGSDAAAAAAEEAQHALAEIRSGAERYLRLRLTGELLRRQIELYREQNQDPVIRRAGEFFARLTLGSFSGLKTGFDEKDNPILLGVRRSGAEVEVVGMSNGTRDQLYLSLRVASLEKQLESGKPLPFIVDDILINFDDERSRATLGVLAELCRKTQILFFTHHARMVELAREIVPGSCLALHDLVQLNPTATKI